MKDAPIIPALDLWSLGHSAGQIAEMLGFPNHKHVTRIVEHARSISDKRAVLHKAQNGRLIGRPGRHARKVVKREKVNGIEVVPAIPQPLCARGHARTPENVNKSRQCKECERLRSIRRKGHR